MLDVPVVLIAFNRPELTRQTFERIRQAAPSRMFIIADGPRPGRPDDSALCKAVRAEVEDIGWPCQVERRYSDSNLGCNASVELGLDWVFDSVDTAIVIEDDCVPDLTFFRYCAELLRRFEDDPRIVQISGNSLLVPRELFGDDSYAFTSFASVWGWATWRRVWRAHRAVFPRDHSNHVPGGPPAAPVRTEPALFRPGVLKTRAGERYFNEVARTTRGDLFTWDSHWWVSLLASGGLSVTPAVNLVQNVGLGEGATHTRSSRELPPAEAMTFPLADPSEVSLLEDVERELELVLVRSNGRLARSVKQMLRPLWLRSVARGITSWSFTWRVARGMSKIGPQVRGLAKNGRRLAVGMNKLVRSVARDPSLIPTIVPYLREPLRSNWDAGEPWWNSRAISFAEMHLTSGSRAFEWGSGGSTVWLAQRGVEVTTVESDAAWADKVQQACPSVAMRLVVGTDSGQYRSELELRDAGRHFFDDYISVIDEFPNDSFDLIIIDGRCRAECARRARKKVKPGGLIAIDDTHWQFQERCLESFDADWKQVRLRGFKRRTAGVAETTFLRRPIS